MIEVSSSILVIKLSLIIYSFLHDIHFSGVSHIHHAFIKVPSSYLH